MKKFLFLGILAMACSCKKYSDTSSVVTPQMLEGKWEIRKQIGGFVGTDTFPPGNGNIWDFTNSTFTIFYHGADIQHGKYLLHMEPTSSSNCTSYLPAPVMTRLLTDPDLSTARQFITIEGNKLTIQVDCGMPDLPITTVYEKIP